MSILESDVPVGAFVSGGMRLRPCGCVRGGRACTWTIHVPPLASMFQRSTSLFTRRVLPEPWDPNTWRAESQGAMSMALLVDVLAQSEWAFLATPR